MAGSRAGGGMTGEDNNVPAAVGDDATAAANNGQLPSNQANAIKMFIQVLFGRIGN